MRHQKAGRRLGRNTSHRKALMRNMATSLLDHERIETTEAKAKELRRYAERMITLGKRGDLHARRKALAFLRKREVVAKVFDEYAERFKDRHGGYTRIMKLGSRLGDNARMAIIEVLPAEGKGKRIAEEKVPKEKKEDAKKTAIKAEKGDKKTPKGKTKKGAKDTVREKDVKEKKEPRGKTKKRKDKSKEAEAE
jgi:large subunit ribosomal protein L17